jgi:hypothetical protein
VTASIASLMQTSQFVDCFLLFWLLVHLNGFLAEGKGFRTILYCFLLFPVQAYSLTTTLDQPSVFGSNLVVNMMINLWLVARSWPILPKGPLAGYRKVVAEVRRDLGQGRKTFW